jgi:ComF family protein
MFSRIVNLLYPAQCHACGVKTIAWDQNICDVCLKKIKKRLPPFCIKCGRQIPGEPEAMYVCNDCKNEQLYFDRAFSVFYYDGILKKLVHNFKYNKMTALAKEFVELVIAFMKEYDIGKRCEIVVSIPMHPFRLFKREINPSEILAKNIAKKLGLHYFNSILKKTKNTPPQSMLSRTERIENLEGSFSLRKYKEHDIKGKNILLVDDLFTTGSTVNECAKVLKEAGGAYIEVITLARADKLP